MIIVEKYNIPFCQKSSFRWYLNAIFLFCTLGMAAGSVIFFVFISKDNPIEGFFFGLFSLGLSSLFGYQFISVSILKRFFIEITEEYLKFSVPFKSKKVYWREIYDVQGYNANNNTYIAILLEKDKNKKRKRTISNNFNSLYGVPACSFQIPLNLFKDIDAQRLLLTIDEQVNKIDKKDVINAENVEEIHEECGNSIVKAISVSVLSCLIIGIIYGFSIYKLEKNYLVIPILGCFLIISCFNKYYIEKSFNLLVRLLVGLICFIQVPIGLIGLFMMSSKLSFTIQNIIEIIHEYCIYLVQNLSEQIIIIIIAVVCFLLGALKGRTYEAKNIDSNNF